MGRFLLTGVGEPVAVAAGEQPSGAVQLDDPAAAVHPVRGDRTHKPGPLATEAAGRPCEGDALFHIAPILAIGAAPVFQGHRLALVSTLIDATCSPSRTHAQENHCGDPR